MLVCSADMIDITERDAVRLAPRRCDLGIMNDATCLEAVFACKGRRRESEERDMDEMDAGKKWKRQETPRSPVPGRATQVGR